ncbi:DNA-3-methyladenine glycosylase, partial [Deinococcus sp.]
MTAPLPPAHFAGNPVQIARNLLGATLVRRLPDQESITGLIVEIEAYDCP